MRTVEGKFIHLEELDDRTRPNDWKIRAHAHADLNHVFHIAAGGGVMHVDGDAIAFTAPCLVLVPSGRVHGFTYEVETTGSVLTIADSYLRDLTAREPAFASLFRAPRQVPLEAGSRISSSLGELSRELVWTAPAGGAAVEGHLLTILVEALRRLVRDEAAAPAVQGGHVTLVARFRELVEAHYREGLPMESYAGRLNVTVARLRAACLRAAGASPLRLVQDRLLLEAKRALLYSNMTVAEVAYHLGFEDPAYFSRFFAKAEGVSPKRYRVERAGHAPSIV
ncbi:AraC family transcriptional activator of pobA [Caulobacter sp. 1776]